MEHLFMNRYLYFIIVILILLIFFVIYKYMTTKQVHKIHYRRNNKCSNIRECPVIPTCPSCPEIPSCPSYPPCGCAPSDSEQKPIKKISDKDRIVRIKQRVYTDILNRTVKAFNKLNVPVFLSSGTCLGYFREGKFIDYDYDIDVGIFAHYYSPKIKKVMAEEGLYLYRVLGNPKDGMEMSFRLKNTPLGKYAKIDVFLHYPETDEDGKKYYNWYTYAAPKFKKKIQYRVSKFKLKRVKFMGINVYVPDPTLKYIEEHYGEDWMIPKRPFTDYIYHTSPKSIVLKNN